MLDIVTYGMSKLIPSALNFFSITYFARMLGPDQYGTLSLVTSGATLLGSLVLQWPLHYLIRFYSATEYSPKQLTHSLLLMQVLTLFVATCGLLVAGVWSGSFVWFGCLAVFTVSQSLFAFTLRVHNVREDRSEYLKLNIGRSVLYFLFGYLVIKWWGPSYVSVALAGVFAYLLTSLFSYPRDSFSKSMLVRIPNANRYIIPVMLSNGLLLSFDTLPRYLLSHFHTSAVTGVFSINYEIIQFSLQSLITVTLLTTGPLLFKKYEKGGLAEAFLVLDRIVTYCAVLAVPAMVVLAFVIDPVVKIVSGKDFVQSSGSTNFLIAVGATLSGIKIVLFDQILLMHKKALLLFKLNIAGFLVNALLCVLLIPPYGAFGAALSVMTAFLFLFVIGAISTFKDLALTEWAHKHLFWTAIWILIAAVLMVFSDFFQTRVVSVLAVLSALWLLHVWRFMWEK